MVCYATVGAVCRFCKRIARNRSVCFPRAFLSLPPPCPSLVSLDSFLLSCSCSSCSYCSSCEVGTTRERPRAKSSEWNRRNLKNILNLITPASLGLSKSSGLPMAGWKIADRRTVRRTSSGVAFGQRWKKRGRREKRSKPLWTPFEIIERGRGIYRLKFESVSERICCKRFVEKIVRKRKRRKKMEERVRLEPLDPLSSFLWNL